MSFATSIALLKSILEQSVVKRGKKNFKGTAWLKSHSVSQATHQMGNLSRLGKGKDWFSYASSKTGPYCDAVLSLQRR